jgi:uncharacterized XkdX family phage protein
MDWYTIVKRHYDAGRYVSNEERDDVAVFVVAGKITPAQYQIITGTEYQGSAE